MKYLIKITFMLCFLSITSINANENVNDSNFSNQSTLIEGTWEWHNGNRIFRVIIFRVDTGGLQGHFEMVEVNNGVQTTIYKSDKKVLGLDGTHYPPAIRGGGNDEGFTGRIMDNSIEYDPNVKEMVEARLEMKIFASGNLTKASWKVKFYDLVPVNRAPLNIPTDIVLTRVSL